MPRGGLGAFGARSDLALFPHRERAVACVSALECWVNREIVTR